MGIVSLNMARQAGFVRYFTGKPCKHGHVAERFVSTRACVECSGKAASTWKKENPEKHAATHRAWVKANPQRASELNAASYRVHRDKRYAENKAWRAANKEHFGAKSVLYRAKRRAAILNRTPAWSDLKAIDEVYRDASEFRQAGIEVDVDHAIPLQGELVSGLHVPGNLRVLLSSVNRSKSNQFHIHV